MLNTITTIALSVAVFFMTQCASSESSAVERPQNEAAKPLEFDCTRSDMARLGYKEFNKEENRNICDLKKTLGRTVMVVYATHPTCAGCGPKLTSIAQAIEQTQNISSQTSLVVAMADLESDKMQGSPWNDQAKISYQRERAPRAYPIRDVNQAILKNADPSFPHQWPAVIIMNDSVTKRFDSDSVLSSQFEQTLRKEIENLSK
jgi:hypothetical protein